MEAPIVIHINKIDGTLLIILGGMPLKLLKYMGYFSLMLLTALTIAGCSAEKAIEKATGGSVKVDKEGNVSIKDKEGGGELTIGSGAKWDKDKMFGLEAPKAKFDSFMSSNGGTTYIFSEMKEQDAKKYIEYLKKEGFTYNFFSVDEFTYSGTNEEGIGVTFNYDKDTKSGLIAAGQGDKPTGEETGTIVESEGAEWDSSKVGGLPDPGVKVTSFTSYGSQVTYSFDPLDNPKDYVEKIKQLGFTEEPMEMESADSYVYMASNSAGENVYFSASDMECSITFTKAE